MAGAHVKKYHQCLMEDFSEREIVRRKMLAVPKEEGETMEQAKERIQRDIKEGITEEEVEMVVRAYADLMLACSEEISFGIVFNSKSTIFPEGDAYMAWHRLKRKYEPSTNAQKIMLRREFHQSRLIGITKSPDDWIEELEIIRARLEALGVIIDDDDLVLQVLEGLPKEYDMLVALLNARYKVDDLDVSSLREELMMYHERLNRYKKSRRRDDDGNDGSGGNNEESALTATFKGRCRGCGEYGHKKSDCPKEQAKSEGGNKFTGSCFFCKKKGHMKKDCKAWLKKKSEQANVTREESTHDEVSLVVMETTDPVRKLVLRSFPNASEDEIINWEKAYRDEIFNLISVEELALIIEEEEDDESNKCCCDISENFYNVLCCRNVDRDDSEDEEAINELQDTEDNNEINAAAEEEKQEDANLAAMDLVASSIEEAFYHMAFGDDDYELSSEENEEERESDHASDEEERTDSVAADSHATAAAQLEESEDAIRERLTSEGYTSFDIDDFIQQSRAYRENEPATRMRLQEQGLTQNEIDDWIYEHRIKERDFKPDDVEYLDHVYSSEEGSRPSHDSDDVTFGYDSDPDYWAPPSNIDHNPQDHESGFMGSDSGGDPMRDDIWLGDTGASSHMTMSLKGMHRVRDMAGSVTVGSGERLKVTKIGDKVGTVIQKNGLKKNIVLRNVKYVPDLNCNLLSLTQVINSGFAMTGNKDGLWIRKGAATFEFDHRIKSGTGVLMGIRISDREASTSISDESVKKLQAHLMHALLGHASNEHTKATCARLGINLSGTFPTCQSCAEGKIRQKNTNKYSQVKATEKGERLCFDISSVRHESSGGAKFWLLVVDEATRYQWSYFMKSKKDTKTKLLELAQELKHKHGIEIKNFRCDNAGENVEAKSYLNNHGFGGNFEFTAKGTPQHNGIVERRFATMYGRIRAILHHCGCPEDLKYKVWAECANISTDLWNIQVQKGEVMSPCELFFGSLPRYAKHLHVFGQMGIVLNGTASTLQNKLKSKGIKKMFVGYSRFHTHDVYRMYNLDTGSVSVTRDIRWLDELVGDSATRTTTILTDCDDTDEVLGGETHTDDGDKDGNNDGDKTLPVSIQKPQDDRTAVNGKESVDDGDKTTDGDETSADGTSSHDITDDDEHSDDEHGHINNPRLQRELRRLHTWYNPTANDMGELAMVGGTDESYVNPPTFNDAWNHPKDYDREKWREGIRKEFKDMIEKGVWKKMKIKDIPSDRRLIGCRWVNKVKRNGVFRARLVALGYSQIPGLDFTENYAPVIQDVTFRLVCVIMLAHGWLAEIVDIETAFLYGDLEEQIFMKIPEGYETVVADDKIDRNQDCFLLIKTIYGVVQAARQFYKKLSWTLTNKLGMKKCLADQCLFVRNDEHGVVMIAIYIDDTLCIGSKKAIDQLKTDIKKHFSTKEEGEMEEYVGCEIKRIGKHKLFMCQSNLISKLDKLFGDKVKGLILRETPAGTGFTVTRCQIPEQLVSPDEQRVYRSGVGILLYLVKFSRPDISNAVRELSKASDGADKSSLKCLYRTIRYVLDTREQYLKYEVDRNKMDSTWSIKTFCDSDFAGDKATRISVSGYCVYVLNCLVAWKSRSQKHVTLSSTEAEYVAISDVCTEIMFIRMVLEFLGVRVRMPITVHCDNIGAIFLSYNAKISQRTKHIDTKYRYVGEYVEQGTVKIVFVRSEDNVADVLTKNTSLETFKKHASRFLDVTTDIKS